MDSDVRHAVVFKPLEIRHSIRVSSSVVSIARELRYSVIAIVLGFTAVSIVRAILVTKKSPRA